MKKHDPLFLQMVGRGLRGSKFGGTKECTVIHQLVGEKMVTPSVEFDPAIYWCLENFEEGVISPEVVVERIEKLVRDGEFSLTIEDMAHTSKTNKQPKWNRNVRNRLLRLKQEGVIAHIGPNQYTKPRDLPNHLRIDHEKAWKQCAETALFYKENQIP